MHIEFTLDRPQENDILSSFSSVTETVPNVYQDTSAFFH